MKKYNIKKVVRATLLIALSAVGGSALLSSCNDFLTITPTYSIVEENFWKDKNDLENAILGCYKQVVSNDMLSKYVQWGEERSDNFERSTTQTATGMVANIMNANLLPTYNRFNWTSAYKAINYCNKVIVHGPDVVATDESFSMGDWLPMRAEAVTLRAFMHFTLVRTFGEIPYVTQDYNNDSQELRLPQSTQLAVLDSIVNDLESVAPYAMTDYGNTVYNKGRVTLKSIYALLADVYLWRASYKAGNNKPFTNLTEVRTELAQRDEVYSTSAESDYQKCIEYCDKVIEICKEEKLKDLRKKGQILSGSSIELILEDLLEQNEVGQTSSLSNLPVTVRHADNIAYDRIFGDGNSDESIFELQVHGISYNNTMITDLFYNIKDNKPGAFTGALSLFESVSEGPNTPTPDKVFTRTDYRRWESIQYVGVGQTTFDIGKYVVELMDQTSSRSAIMMQDNTASTMMVTTGMRSTSNLNANWIVYRMSEIFLMKAEAMSQLYADEENLMTAFNYVREVFKRSNPYAYEKNNSKAATDSLKFTSFATQDDIEKLVLAERQREFIGEGKRWYDLVRYAQRHGNTAPMLDILCRKYASNSKAIRAKLATIQSLFSPVFDDEIINNDLLYQNGVWQMNESSERIGR